MIKSLALAGAIAVLSALPAAADLIKIPSQKPVAETMDALQAAVEGAGATVFARVDHAGGAQKVDLSLGDAQLLIFGNPKLGTPVMQADPRAGLFLPLKILAYQDAEGQVWLTYEDPAEMLSALDVPTDAEAVAKMQGALGKLTGAAVK
ncbi:hypothetical protein PhaeoP18_00835 [Phaeobacter piscinae]|uniref:DUF302 domain-containing protein n=1 Tax=Phaeobacter piscinae TaxID=1580596 RepID=A0AAN1GPK7_9RHOB|nr:DUF302 domain-containing protein [Phaeobacter piscinae]ATG42803.1 hypothetical protein PhaeoP13_00850 [Phaeobacter piscinae]AUQ75046.1 hypothetical protein PhaeoP71_02190 [Phaeobacter piscinae]AUR35121.1 hypothetical protein PhaeoP18_00835 [Phaeobacter piscinae]